MNAPLIEPARVSDAKAIQDLIGWYANRREMLHRSLNEIFERIRDYSVIRAADGKLAACCCLSVCWADLAEVKALAVRQEDVGRGLGTALVKKAIEDSHGLGVNQLFALTYQKSFFLKLGFHEVEMDHLPKKVWGECIRCSYYPDCNEEAVIMDLHS